MRKNAADVTDATTVSSVAKNRKGLRGIKLARNLDAAIDEPRVLSKVVTQGAPEPKARPENAAPPLLSIPMNIRPATPETLPTQSLFTIIWSSLRKPPRWALASLSALAIAWAGLVSMQHRNPSDDASASHAMQSPAMAGPNGEPLYYGPAPYQPVAYRPYVGPGYGGHYHYR